MRPRTAVVLGLIVCVGIGAFLGDMMGRDFHSARAARKTTEQRAEAGPYIAITKDISKDETVRVLVIPHPLGEFFDTTCVIYTNREVGTATMNCPTAHQGEISVPENR